ncbi:hypothetical protein [Aquibacillus saliphilus]|uniref:hypothetical protein n=1 Tax=Aquibacillus saliphilus TaxID=1909422 RepID=UPI001CF0BDD9|nr:hypothetical protein [Aquibacillus saliphilus]
MFISSKTLDNLFDYYKDQFYKMLNLFECQDKNAFKYGNRIRSEIEQLPFQIPELYDDYRFNIVIMKMDVIVEELFFLDGEHQFIRNHVFESMNLLDDIKEGLK